MGAGGRLYNTTWKKRDVSGNSNTFDRFVTKRKISLLSVMRGFQPLTPRYPFSNYIMLPQCVFHRRGYCDVMPYLYFLWSSTSTMIVHRPTVTPRLLLLAARHDTLRRDAFMLESPESDRKARSVSSFDSLWSYITISPIKWTLKK